jgi:hypothetical protein
VPTLSTVSPAPSAETSLPVLFTVIFLSVTSRFAVFTVTVVPFTVKSPGITT